jgi:hypothetical protein
MTDTITLRRAAEYARVALDRLLYCEKSCNCFGRDAITALDAALAEPKETFADSLARRSWEAHRAALAEPQPEPERERAAELTRAYQEGYEHGSRNARQEPATVEQIDEEYIRPVIDARWHDFEVGFRAAERFHGIGGSKT